VVTARDSVARIVGALQNDSRVQRVLVAGSVRDGTDDEVSDLDLWLVADDWSPDQVEGLFLAGTTVAIGESPLFHAVDWKGVIVDVRYGPMPPPEYVELEQFTIEGWPPGQLEPSGLFTDFWINSYKARKPLWRGLDAMVVFGMHFERMGLVRAWVGHDTGTVPGHEIFSIHGLTPIVRDHITPGRQELLGLPMRNRRELLVAIQAYRDEMRRLSPAPSRLAELVLADPLFLDMCASVGL
jgi:hypothetical protein